MDFALIGTGARSLAYREEIRRLPGQRVAVLCDLDADRLAAYHRRWFDADPAIRLETDFRAAVSGPDVDVVVVCTPDTAHVDVALAAAAAGKHLLVEKPVATTRADLLRAYRGLKDHPGAIQVGFVLRYAPFFRALRDVVRSGRLGTVVGITAAEMLDPRHAGSFYRRWHRFSRNNGGLLNAKCSHDLDLLNWVIGCDPVSVSAAGGLRHFVPDPSVPATCRGCPRYDTCPFAFDYAYYDRNYEGFHSLSDLCVYNSEKDIVDHESLLLRYEDGTVARFELRMLAPEETRRWTVVGSAATLDADFLRNEIRIRPLRGGEEVLRPDGEGGGHGGGDEGLVADLVRQIEAGAPENRIRAGVLASLTALAADESLADGLPRDPRTPELRA